MSKLVFGNQKMYMNMDDAISFANEIKNSDLTNVVIFPSSIYLYLYKDLCSFGSQNVSIYENGAHTGEISIDQIKSMGATYSLVGHSERRKDNNETDDLCRTKVEKLIEKDVIPVLCIGENEDENINNKTLEVLKRQINAVFTGLKSNNLIIAYEPIWAIGTGRTPTNEDIDETVGMIKDYVKNNYNFDIRVLYGGSVSPKNIDNLNNIDIIDGYLIGGSSSKIDELKYIIEKCK